MSGHLGRELGRSYPFPVQGLHLSNIPAVAHHEATGGFLPEAFNGAAPAQNFGFKPDYGPQGGMVESHPGGGDVPRAWYPFPTGGDAWNHPPGFVMGPYGVTQPGEACQGLKPDIKVERDCDHPAPYYGHPWAGGCLMPPTPTLTHTGPQARPGNSREAVSPGNEPQPSSSPVSQHEELGSAESSPRSDGSRSPNGQMALAEVKDEGGSGDEVRKDAVVLRRWGPKRSFASLESLSRHLKAPCSTYICRSCSICVSWPSQ